MSYVWNRISFEAPKNLKDESVLTFRDDDVKVAISESALAEGVSFADFVEQTLSERKGHSEKELTPKDENGVETAQINRVFTVFESTLLSVEIWVCAAETVTQVSVSGARENEKRLVSVLQGLMDSMEFEFEREL